MVIRLGRFFYIATGAFITASWYTGYVNERTPVGSGPTFILPGTNLPVIGSPDRPSKSVPDIFGDILSSSGTGLSGKSGVTGVLGDLAAAGADLTVDPLSSAKDIAHIFAGSGGSSSSATKGRSLVPVTAASHVAGSTPPSPLAAGRAGVGTQVAEQAKLYEGIPATLKTKLALATAAQLKKFGYIRLSNGDIVKATG